MKTRDKPYTALDGDLPTFSRAIVGGKRDSKLEARISYELKESIRRRWMDLHFASESEYLEYLTTVDCFGKEHVRMVMEKRLSLVSTLSDSATAPGQEAA